MHATSRGRVAYDLVVGRPGSPPVPPPPPARMRSGARAVGHAAHDADPKWLEDAVLRIIRKHGLQVPAPEPADVEIEVDEHQFLPAPSRLWRIARTTLVLALLAASAGAVARWRYPSQTATFVTTARGTAARIGPPSTWLRALRAHVPSLHSPGPADPISPVLPPPAPTAAAEPLVSSPAPAALPPIAPAPTPSTVSITSLPLAAADGTTARPGSASHLAPVAPKATPTDNAPPAPKPEPKHAAHLPHPAPVVASPAVTAEEPPPAPGSLAEAIKRAGAGGKPAPVAERASTPDPKPAIDGALPERPSASMVTSALLAVLPDARACMSDGDEPTRAVVVFEPSGTVGSVQASGASAPCIQKALARAHVAPFSQASYRATVPVRPN
jgi:hypothetical protein